MSELGCAFVELLFRHFGCGALPDYSATVAIASRDPYRALREQLRSITGLDDSTDLNYDLGASWWFRRGDVSWNLRLSFVGPFAVLLRDPGEVVTADPMLDAARSHGFTVLSRADLEIPVRVWEPEVQGSLYEFLFEFDNGTPWDP